LKNSKAIKEYPLLLNCSLWPHQKGAIDKCIKYIYKYENKYTSKSCLIQMPTGSGKTGVITIIARCIPKIKNVLIITPRLSLRKQLYKDVLYKFFDNLEVPPKKENILKEILELEGGNSKEEHLANRLETEKDLVVVTTFQKIESMKKNDIKTFNAFKKEISVLLIDEGHYEPAFTWSKTIREFNIPKIIFTATPFRNDLKMFDIDLNHSFIYTFKEAVDERFLRDVEIIEKESTCDPHKFVEDVVNFYNNKLGMNSSKRVIIRCDKSDSIRQIASALRNKKIRCIAIHEKFKNKPPFEYRNVPDPSEIEAKFWIHQFKLLEGIDDYRFKMLALFEPLNSGKAFVQQVGRIVRNPKRLNNQKCFVLDHSNGKQKGFWERYIKYDKGIKEGNKKILIFNKEIMNKYIENEPEIVYLNGDFKEKFHLEQLNPLEDLQIPLRVNLLLKGEGFDIEKLAENLNNDYRSRDFITKKIRIGTNTYIIAYIYLINSYLLKNKIFFENRFGITFIRELANIICFYDSINFLPINDKKYNIYKPVKSKDLKKIFRNHKDCRLTMVSFKNSNLKKYSIRGKTISAVSIKDTIPDFDDYAQICTSARGYSVEKINNTDKEVGRYLGVKRGRISQISNEKTSVEEYIQWVDEIAYTVNKKISPIKTFNRYLNETKIPEKTEPISILLDLNEVLDDYLTTDDKEKGIEKNQPLSIEELCIEIKNNKFKVFANNNYFEVSIFFEENTNRYKLYSEDLEKAYYSKNNINRKGIIDYLNKEQSFRVIPKTKDYIYCFGQFYKIDIPIGKFFNKSDFQIGKILKPIKILENIKKEKGIKTINDENGWQKDSVFGMIDNLGNISQLDNNFGDDIKDMDIIVCDDACKNEIADFICANTKNNKIIFIHAKANINRKPCSASALMEVCGQAVKNLFYISLGNKQEPPNINFWEKPWKVPRVEGRVLNRIRKGDKNPYQLWDQINNILKNPLTDREVWIVLGQILSKSKFLESLSNNSPSAEAIQLLYLLQSVMIDVAKVGAKLKIFCMP
jgi:hypothetical protein